MPAVDDSANAFAYQVVRVSGTFAWMVFLPVFGLKNNKKFTVSSLLDFHVDTTVFNAAIYLKKYDNVLRDRIDKTFRA